MPIFSSMDSGFRDSAHDTSTMSGTPYTFDDDLSLSHTNPRLSPGTSFGAPDSMSSYTLDTSRLTAEQVETIFWQAQSIPNQSIRSGYQAVSFANQPSPAYLDHTPENGCISPIMLSQFFSPQHSSVTAQGLPPHGGPRISLDCTTETSPRPPISPSQYSSSLSSSGSPSTPSNIPVSLGTPQVHIPFDIGYPSWARGSGLLNQAHVSALGSHNYSNAGHHHREYHGSIGAATGPSSAYPQDSIRQHMLRPPSAASSTGHHDGHMYCPMVPAGVDVRREVVSVSVAPPIDIISLPSREDDVDEGGQGQKRSEEGKLLCTVSGCASTFKGQYELKRHLGTVHDKIRAPCPQCGKSLSCQWAVDRHIEKSCGKNNKPGPKPRERQRL